jgi:hypothetical protein
MPKLRESNMRTNMARAATAAIALAMAGGAGLTTATHAAAATNNHTCTSLILVAPVQGVTGIDPEVLVGTGCDIQGTGARFKKGTVTGQVVGWANPRTFAYTSSLCQVSLKTCDFNSPTLLPKK